MRRRNEWGLEVLKYRISTCLIRFFQVKFSGDLFAFLGKGVRKEGKKDRQ